MEFKEIVYAKLAEMKVPFSVINHKAIFSEKDTEENIFDNDVIIGKNLFLRNNKKNKYYLISLPLNKRANLDKLAELLGEKRLSFANELELKECLNITPGSVSYLNVITANGKVEKYKEITYIVDKEFFKADKVGFHPSDNTATVVTSPDSILKLYENYSLMYKILEI